MARGPQLAFAFRTRGGKRKGAGRPPKGSTAGVSHLRRPALSRHHPVHVTLRIAAGVPSLREGRLFDNVRMALGGRALARGLQGLSVRVARAVNRTLARRGRLFADRYHARALKTPRAAHFAVRYVLLNARKHGAAVAPGFIDGCSSAAWFGDFSRPDELAFGAAQTRAQWRTASGLEAPVVVPETWLL